MHFMIVPMTSYYSLNSIFNEPRKYIRHMLSAKDDLYAVEYIGAEPQGRRRHTTPAFTLRHSRDRFAAALFSVKKERRRRDAVKSLFCKVRFAHDFAFRIDTRFLDGEYIDELDERSADFICRHAR